MIAQLVEHWPEELGVTGSSPVHATIFIPAKVFGNITQWLECLIVYQKVAGSSPAVTANLGVFMPCQVIGRASGQIDVKRFYIPGVKVIGNCKHCGKPVSFDMASHYLSYPVFGSESTEYFYCEPCDENTEFKIQLDLRISVL